MRDFENFLCFSSAMAWCERAGSAEVQERRLWRRKTKENAEEKGRKERGKRQGRRIARAFAGICNSVCWCTRWPIKKMEPIRQTSQNAPEVNSLTCFDKFVRW